jgi:hypothetical protein
MFTLALISLYTTSTGHLELGEPVQLIVTVDMERLDGYFAHELRIKNRNTQPLEKRLVVNEI